MPFFAPAFAKGLQPKNLFKTPLKKLSEQVIVITGASSGIGLATALEAARRGASLVIASRNETALAETKKRIEDLHGEVVYVVADVGNPDDVQKIANVAITTYGGFDTWINDAGVGILGKLEEITQEDSQRLFDTNFWGIVYGSLTAAAHLKYKGGAIINLGSVLSDIAMPLQGMYCASKHAVKGFTDTLRQELEADKARVSVTLIKPAAIATPFFSHSKNYTHHDFSAPSPVYAPEAVAYAILHAAEHPVRDVRVGSAGLVMAALGTHTPRLMDWINEKMMVRSQQSKNPKSRHKNNLHESGIDGEVHGKNMPRTMPNIYTRAALHPVATSVAVTAVGVVAFALLGKRGRLGKAAVTGMNILLPLQNAVMAKGLLKMFQKRSDQASKAFAHNIQAVNQNAKVMKQKTMALLK